MPLWEITLATAYFLGLKRTYKIALKLQRKIISPKYPKIRQFAHRKTRAVFDVVLKVHRNIQARDIEVGKNFGNRILRWLDKMKPSAEIRARKPSNGNENTTKKLTDLSNQKKSSNSQKFDSRRHYFTSSIGTMMNSSNPGGVNNNYRQFSICRKGEILGRNNGRFGYEGVIRKDIMQCILRN